MAKKVAISQSNYIPWKGYFDSINMVDEFVLYDDVQYTRRDWRNRNQIKTKDGLKWLSIPVQVKGRFSQNINETLISDPGWAARHWQTIQGAYAKAAHFAEYRERFADLYAAGHSYLSDINREFIRAICGMLGIGTPLRLSGEFELAEDRTERLVHICKQLDAEVYYSGPAAKAYLDESQFEREGISVRYFEYGAYPEYRQLHGDFVHAVSVIDLLFNEGPQARSFLKSTHGVANEQGA